MDRQRTIRAALGLATAIALVVPTASANAAAATVSRTVTGLSARSDSVFPATIVEGGRELGRTRIVWSTAKESGRKASYAVTYSFGSQVQGVKAPAKIRALYYDRVTQTNVLAMLSFIRQTATPSTPISQTERFFHVSTDATSYPLFAGARLPFSAAIPTFAGGGVSDALLASMYYDPSLYSIIGAAWDGPKIDNDGEYARWAVYSLRRTGTTYSAIYGANVALPDARVYNGVAYYSADPAVVAAAHEATPAPDATGTPPAPRPTPRKPSQPPPGIWPYVAAAAGTLAAAGLVVFWYKRRKKRPADAEDEFAPDEYHDPDAGAE